MAIILYSFASFRFELSAQESEAEISTEVEVSVEGGKAELTPKNPGILLKDMARISGVRSNQLLGYGIVAGLPGTGDSRSPLAQEAMKSLLLKFGIDLQKMPSGQRNMAAVLVTCELPPFARTGDRLGVRVSSVGDARSLKGGVLIQTPLYAGNGAIFAVAQGPVATGGEEGNTSRRPGEGKNVGLVMSGAIVERDLEDSINRNSFRITLDTFDFGSLASLRDTVRKNVEEDIRVELDGASVLVTIPHTEAPEENSTKTDPEPDAEMRPAIMPTEKKRELKYNPVDVIAKIESLRVPVTGKSRIVINERTGVVIMGGDIRIDPVAVASIRRKNESEGRVDDWRRMGIYVHTTRKEDDPSKNTIKHIRAGSVKELVDSLNEMGYSTAEVISVLESLKDSGALHAELVVL